MNKIEEIIKKKISIYLPLQNQLVITLLSVSMKNLFSYQDNFQLLLMEK